MIAFIFFYLILIAFVLIILNLGIFQAALISSVLILLSLIIVMIFLVQETYRVIILGNAPYVPSSKKLIKKILEEVDFKTGGKVYELGCGNAKFLRELVKKRNVQAIGYEYFIIPFLQAKLSNFISKKKIKVFWQNFFKADLSQADYIFCFLMTKEMERLKEKLKKELKPGAIIISHAFTFKDWQPERIIALNEAKHSALNNKIFIYKI